MFRSLEIKLGLPIVLPLLDLIRERAATVDAADSTPANRHDLKTLLELFRPDFSHTGVIFVSGDNSPAVLRACAFLRIELRQKNLFALSDSTMESGERHDPDLFAGEEKRALMCYLFLASLQQSLIGHFILYRSEVDSVVRAFKSGLAEIGNRFRRQRATPIPEALSTPTPANSASREIGEVVVLNDPVNLMNYVTTVLQIALDLPLELAQHRTREIHEAKSSKVWRGPQHHAEAHVRMLRAWHLNAVLRAATED